MYHIHLINSSGNEEASSHTSSLDRAVELIKSALETLKTLPEGAKIEIDYEE